ncbi:hypothetical protein RUM43_008465 [Polyplax serrata]|uniref:Carboxylic ester hydrolase n=1 Tax=Polyplax serrata TaxID=468196 RepID=A0AAN8S1B5_POLSC
MAEQKLDFAVVEISDGILRGKKVISDRGKTYMSFQGIPYGKAPVGELRFKAPEPADPWPGTRDALKEGPVAPSLDFSTRKYGENCSEDCLYLNVYTPQLPKTESDASMAVMFWIHGGGFTYGSGGTDFYGPDYLVTEDVVVVTCNYRLGALGFLSLQTAECPGNYGLKDLILALKWCQKNISKFGGNPNNVTIFGESAGGASVHYLTLSKMAEGLFHRAIAQSGVCHNSWGLARKPRESAFKLAEYLGCKTNDEKKVLECLKAATPMDLVKYAKHILHDVDPNEYYTQNAFVPCVEPSGPDSVIDKHPDDLYKNGEMKRIPFMLGANTLEGLVMIALRGDPTLKKLNTETDLYKLIPVTLNVQPDGREADEIKNKIKTFYFKDGFDENNYVRALSQIYFLNGINQVIEHQSHISSNSHPTFVYHYVYDGDVFCLKTLFGYGHWKGTCHGDEISYLFKMNIFKSTISPGTRDFAMMETLTKIWTDFAKTGNPLPGGSWSPISVGRLPYMEIGETLTQKADLEKSDFEFWQDIHKIASRDKSNCKL